MNKKRSPLKHLVVISAFLLPLNLMAQDDLGELFKSSPQDATKLVDAYMNPLFKGMGIGFNSGWNNTAKTKSFLRFDLRVTVTAAFVPTKDQTYNTNSLGLTSIRPASGSNGIGPAIIGNNAVGSKMEVYSGNTVVQTFNLPQGTGLKFAPSPQIQLTVGLPKNIDVSLRYIPGVKLGSDFGKIDQFGAGAKIELLPLIMGKKDKLVPFDLAVALGFTNTTYTKELDVNNGKYDNQDLEIKFKGFQAEAIISKKIAFFTPFASVGYHSSNSSLNAYGTYEFQTAAGSATFTDPVSLKNDDISGLKAALGFQLNLGFFRFYSSYTQAEYGFLNAGIGFGIGK
ncbi:DUF6588 family protein [Pedobacter frigiditerrae]|uniref:DUF6588 family protein n=1 Tax=Pedobacter frigiditerrae TaxID=2530452 RepID=UPI002930A00C|nr:DUF6588 family protein [Pedobacter frigiditerrae]